MTTVRYFFFFLLCTALFAVADTGHSFAQQKTKPVREAPQIPKKPDDLDLIDVGKVVEIKKADIITLSTGKSYHLDEIRVPVMYDEVAISYLQSTLLGKMVGIYAVKGQKIGAIDRYGYLYGHVLRDDALWVQADMVARGLAWAFSTETNRTLILPLYKYEATARASKEGFWKDPDYAIKKKFDIGFYLNSFQLYRGVVTGRVMNNERIIMTCDEDKEKSTPFSFSIRPDKAVLFARPAQKLRAIDVTAQWINTMVRVRGWVEKDMNTPGDGATIELTHPEQIEFLDPTTGEALQ